MLVGEGIFACGIEDENWGFAYDCGDVAVVD